MLPVIPLVRRWPLRGSPRAPICLISDHVDHVNGQTPRPHGANATQGSLAVFEVQHCVLAVEWVTMVG